MADTKATLKTNRGDIVIKLFPNHAPKTVDNFVGLAEGTKDYTTTRAAAASRSTTASASTASSTAS